MKRTLALIFLFTSATVYPQAATERYIPIGRSPGISNLHSVQGTIESFTDSVVVISGVRVEVKPSMDIWLDRSKAKVTNLRGSVADLIPGRRAEAYALHWIKIEVTQ